MSGQTRRRREGVFRRLIACVIPVLPMILATNVGAKPIITDVRIGEHAETTRLVLELSEKIAYTVAVRNDPDRLVIVLPPVGWDPTSLQSHGAGLVADYRMSRPNEKLSKILVDLRHPAFIRTSAMLPLKAGLGHKLVIDIVPASGPEQTVTVPLRGGSGVNPAARFEPVRKPNNARFEKTSLGAIEQELLAASREPKAELKSKVEQSGSGRLEKSDSLDIGTGSPTRLAVLGQLPLPMRKPQKYRKKIIVIDAGHGGHDSGAIGRSGLQEKRVTLAIAKRLAQSLRNSGRYEVKLTRDDDRFLRLRQRVNVARKSRADLFLSIHADWTRRAKASGVSVYTLSERASDKEAAALAVRENKSGIISGVDLSHEGKDVSSILIDLAQRETMNRSARLAGLVVKEMRARMKVLQRTHRFAGFAVLKAPDVPSILIETGFLSNRADERNLRSKKHQDLLVKGIHEAIDAYFSEIDDWGS